ncbi:MAG TPA: hypothetical protein VF668_12050, partial [Pyrinomonadaceae bacterium]
MAGLCVVHLVWKPLGVAPFARFLDAYARAGGGVAHDFAVVFNGFGGEEELREYRALLGRAAAGELTTPRPVQDIPAYFAAAERLDYEHLCFVNSHSAPLDGEWLAKLYEHGRREGVGVAGATGSWESLYTDYVAEWRRRFPPRPYRGWLRNERETLRTALRLRKEFAPFPNPHLRTNAFLVRRRVMLALEGWDAKIKDEAHRFESGRAGMTRQVEAMGLKALVVGRDGRGYEPAEWAESFTFRRGEQHNLLVSDNQTRYYEAA